MLSNFTVVDITRTLEASLLLALILYIPGYVVGWLSNVFAFRERRFAAQCLLSTPVGVAVVPILIYLLGRYPTVLWILFGASWLALGFLFRRVWKRWSPVSLQRMPRVLWVGTALALIWAFVAVASMVDLQFKDRLYFSSTAYDYSTRSAFTAAAARAIPPANPFFADTPPVPLRYHHFWVLVCSLATRLGNPNPRQAMYGGTVWAGIALMSLIAIALRFFVCVQKNFERKALIGCGLLLVTGLDILPTLFLYLRFRHVTPDMESWNEPILSWVDSVLFTPHHVMSLVACVVGLLALRAPGSTKYQRAAAIVIAGLAFASSIGLSVFVSFTFALFLALWLPFAALRRSWDDVARLVAACAVGFVAALPYIRTLMGRAVDGSGPGGGRFLALSIRDFSWGIDLICRILHTSRQELALPGLFNLLFLPMNYFLELGFFFIVGALRIRSIRNGSTQMTREEQTGWMMVAASFLIGSFLRSTTIGSNDLGWRCFLPAQLVLLLWATLMVDDWWSLRHLTKNSGSAVPVFAGILAVIGIIGTCYQVSMLRAYPILVDAGRLNPVVSWLGQDHQLGERTFALRSVYDSLGARLPPDAIVQYNPDAREFIPHQLYSGHSAAIGLPGCGAVFGGDISRCAGRTESIVPLFESPSRAESASLDSICRQYGINVMLVDDSDPVWGESDSWVWTRDPVLANKHVRAFACGDSTQQAGLVHAH